MAAFGAEVQRLRTERELSARELATMVNMSQPAITQIETGKRGNAGIRLLWDFAQALGVSASHFVSVCERAVVLEEAKRVTRKTRRTK